MDQCSPCYDSSHAMSDEVNDNLVIVNIPSDITFDFLGQSEPHNADISICVHFISARNHKHRHRKHFEYLSLDYLHVEGAGLEAVDHHN